MIIKNVHVLIQIRLFIRQNRTNFYSHSSEDFFFLFILILSYFSKILIGKIYKHEVKREKVHLMFFLSLEQKLDKLLSPFPTNCRNLYATEYGRAEHVHYL